MIESSTYLPKEHTAEQPSRADIILVNCPSPGKFPGVPNGLLTVATAIKEAGFSVKLVDPALDQRPANEVVLEALQKTGAPIVAITDYSPFHVDALELARDIKQAFPNQANAPIIGIGGWHPTALGGTVENNPNIDFEIRGDGEYPLTQLLKHLHGKRDANISGLTYRNNEGTIIKNNLIAAKKRESWVTPDTSLLENPDAYKLPLFNGKKTAQVIGFRGCPFPCEFCGASNFAKEKGIAGPRPIDHTIAEIEQRRKEGVKAIFFDNPVFTINYETTRELLKYLETTDLEWACQTRVDRMPPDILEEMAKAGCSYIFIGFEAGDQNTLDLMKKKVNPQMNWKAIDNARHAGINVGVSIMFGFPGQNDEQVIPTLEELAKYQVGVTTSAALFAYYPGTEMWTKATKAGIVQPNAYDTKRNRGKPWNLFDEGEGSVHALDMTEDRAHKLFTTAKDILGENLY